jgi:small-conductance mechanosensitive channel
VGQAVKLYHIGYRHNIPDREIALLVNIGVSYGSDLENVEKITCDVASEVMQNTPGAIAGFKPFVRYHTFADFSVNFSVIMRVSEFVDQYFVKHEFIKRLHSRYRSEGIEIPFPIRTIKMENVKSDVPGHPTQKKEPQK